MGFERRSWRVVAHAAGRRLRAAGHRLRAAGPYLRAAGRRLRAAPLGAVVAVAVGIAIAGVAIGLRLAGPSTVETEIGRVALEVAPSNGGAVELYVPVADWGLRADAFEAPFTLRIELRALDRAALLDAAAGDRAVITRAEDDLVAAARGAVLRAAIWGVAAVAVLTAIAFALWPAARRRGLLPGLVAVATAVLVGGGIGAARVSFDATALDSPDYYARGGELNRILTVAESERVRSAYGSELESILRSVGALLADGPAPAEPGRDLYLGSDLHGNVLAIDPIARFIRDGPLLLAGDFGQRANTVETQLIVPRVAALGDEVVAISGNHDSALLMSELARAGVTVLTDDGPLDGDGNRPAAAGSASDREPGEPGSPLIELEGLTIAGYPDPLEATAIGPDAPERVTAFEDVPNGAERAERAIEEFREWFDALPEPPDIVIVHQNLLAQSLAAQLFDDGYSLPLTILTGHDHRQHVDRYGSITVVDAGTIGAGGVFEAGDQFAGIAELHFEAARPVLRSVDLIAVEPFSGRARASRVVIETLCPGERRCTYEPPEDVVTVPGE